MRAILASLGTTGDFEPLLALAVELKRRGHEPLLANSPDFAARADRHSIEFARLAPPLAELNLKETLARSLRLTNSLEQARSTIAAILPFVPRMVRHLEELCRGADVLICFPYQIAGFIVHERIGIPYVALNFSPFGPVAGKQWKDATAEMINDCRRGEGLVALSDPLGDATLCSNLALFAVSEHVFRRPKHWPPHYHLTGYFFVDDDSRPDSQLEHFLTGGSPPLVITFGSMTHEDPPGVTRLLLDAIEQTGVRAIIQAGWSGLGSGEVPACVQVCGFVPHCWLFPRAACIVHHGAAGTTAAALRAGVPSVIVPHMLDQPLWAQLMRGFGAASSVVPYLRLTSVQLADGIGRALSTDSQSRAAALGGKIRSENGVGHAAQLIEHLIGAK